MTLRILALSLLLMLPLSAQAEVEKPSIAENYSAMVYSSYQDALAGAKELQSKIAALIAKPSNSTLSAAKKAWIAARIPYSQTEVYRFYEGPIDFADDTKDTSGPEASLNAWPLNEAYIDYVKGNLAAGIIQDKTEEISPTALTARNQQRDEKDVSTGYHAIEFLLWGQDENATGPGERPVSDYLPSNPSSTRRAQYLTAVSQLLVDDLQMLVDAWKPDTENYRAEFIALPENAAIAKILTGAASLASTEMAGERMNNSLISGDQEDEQSCFSDTTNTDFIFNLKGIENVYLGNYDTVSGASVSDKVKTESAKLDASVRDALKTATAAVAAIDAPYDQVLASPEDSAARTKVKNAISALQDLALVLQEAGKAIGANVVIVSE